MGVYTVNALLRLAAGKNINRATEKILREEGYIAHDEYGSPQITRKGMSLLAARTVEQRTVENTNSNGV